MAKKKPIAVIDCETDPFEHGVIPEPFIWGFYDGSIYAEFTRIADLIEYLAEFDGYVYAHNGGKFDFHFLTNHIDLYEPLKIIHGRIAEFCIGKAILRDSYLLLPTSLAAFNKMEFDYTKLLKKNRAQHMPEIRAYLKADCTNLFAYIDSFFTSFPRALTLPGCAFKVWRKMTGTETPKSDKNFFDTFRPFYFGGRVEPMQTGIIQGPLTMVDINSAYPRAMLERHPWGTKYVTSKHVNERKLDISFITFEGANRGMLPLRGKTKIDYTIENGTFHCTGHEFKTGLETGSIEPRRIIQVLTFIDWIDFREYVDHFYKMKLDAQNNSDKTARTFAKLFLNSLYGRMAMNPENFSEYMLGKYGDKIQDYEPDAVIGERQLFTKPVNPEQSRYYNLATAASITGWVRAFLWESILKTTDPIYCDTDSILCRDPGQLTISDELGAWDIEAKAAQAAIAGRKLYALWDSNGKAIKARSKGARLTADEIYRVANGEVVKYKPEVPTFSVATGIKFTNRKIQLTA